MDPIAVAFIAHLLSAHINVPEPVFVRWNPRPADFEDFQPEFVGTIDMVPGKAEGLEAPKFHWILGIDKEWWDKAPSGSQKWILAHELCHAVHTYPRNWDRMSKREQEKEHEIVNRCANQAISAHLHRTNH